MCDGGSVIRINELPGQSHKTKLWDFGMNALQKTKRQ